MEEKEKIPSFGETRKKHSQRTANTPNEEQNALATQGKEVLFSKMVKSSAFSAPKPEVAFEKILEDDELKGEVQVIEYRQSVCALTLTEDEEQVFGELQHAVDRFCAKHENNQLKPVVYAVGGWVRDKLLGRKSKDIDLVVYPPDLDTLEHRLLELPRVRVKRLDRMGIKKEILRVDLKGAQLDIRGMDEPNLHKDVVTRDFDINCVYYNLKTRKVEDPLKAIDESFGRNLFRAAHNMADMFSDKNRYLRLFRLKHTLGFEVEGTTFDYFKLTARDKFRVLDKEDKKRLAVELRKTFQQPSGTMKKILEEYLKWGILDSFDPTLAKSDLKELVKYLGKLKLVLETEEARVLVETILEIERPVAQEFEELMVQGFCFFFYRLANSDDHSKEGQQDQFRNQRVRPGFGIPSFSNPLPKDLYYNAGISFFEETPLKIFKRYYEQLNKCVVDFVDSQPKTDKKRLEDYVMETDRNKIGWAFLVAAQENSKATFKQRISDVLVAGVDRNNEDPRPSKWNLPMEGQTSPDKGVPNPQHSLKLLSAGSLYRRNKKIYMKEDDGWED